MTNILKTPLSPDTVSVLVSMGVLLFVNHKTGQLYVHKRYWNSCSVAIRQAIVRIIEATELREVARG